MKVEELPLERLVGCPRYLTAKRFSELAGLGEHQYVVDRWITEGTLPTRWFGQHCLIDMQALALPRTKGLKDE